MYLDAALGSQNAFGLFYAYCQTRQDGAKQKLEFIQMARVLNPKLGLHARDFFPSCLRTTSERATYLFTVMDWRDLSSGTAGKIQHIACLAQLGEHSFDIAYIERLRDLNNYAWHGFCNTNEGERINADMWGTDAERDGLARTLDEAKRDNAADFAKARDYPDPGPPSRRQIEEEAVRQAVSKELEGLNLSPWMAELMLLQRTDERLKDMAERRQRIAKEEMPPLAQAVRPQLYRPSSRSPVPMPVVPPVAAPAPAVVLPAAMPVRSVHHRRAQAIHAHPLQIPSAAASASSAAAAGRAEIADALRRQGKCVPRPVRDPSVACQGPLRPPRPAVHHIQIAPNPPRPPRPPRPAYVPPIPNNILNHL